MRSLERALRSWSGLLTTSAVVLTGIAVLSLTGCRATKPLSEKEYVTKTDSVLVRETLRDTVVRIRADSASIRALLECDSLGRVRMRELLSLKASGRMPPPTISIKDNVIHVQAKVDSMSVYLALKDRYQTRIRSDTSIRERVVPVYVQRTWQKFLCWSGALLWLLLLGWLGFRAYKRFKPYLKSI